MSQTCSSTSAAADATDTSCRWPVLYLFGSALVWLFVGLALTLLASAKLNLPALLAGWEWFTYGRVEAAGRNALLFGFASQLGLGLTLWLLSRLGNTRLAAPGLAIVAIVFWNLALTLGVPAILIEGNAGLTWLEFPKQLTPILGLSIALLSLVGFATFAKREGELVPSQWFSIAALLALPVLYLTALVTVQFFPVRGVVQAVIGGWFSQGLLLLWLAPLSLAALYHFVPEITGRPLRSSSLAPFGFWTFVLFASWTGAAGLVGGPLPAWLVTVSVAAGVLLLIPVTLVSLNLHVGAPQKCTPAAGFAAFGVTGFTAVGLALALTAPRCAQGLLHFTQFNVALRELFLFGFVVPALFAGVYVVLPRLAGRALPCSIAPTVHLACTALGLVIVVIASAVGGWKQAWTLADAKSVFAVVNSQLRPWLWLHTFGLSVFAFGQLALAANVAWLIFECVKPLRQPVTELFIGTRPAAAGK